MRNLASRLRERLTYANVVSTLCLFIVLGGSSYAAIVVSGKNVKNSSLTGLDIKDRSLLAKDFKAGELPRGPRGQEGPAGPQGPKGDSGAKGADAPPPPQPPAAPDPVEQQLTIEGLGTFAVNSFSWGGTAPGAGAGGGGPGAATFQDLSASREPDSRSPALFRAAVRGSQFRSATLEVSAPGGGARAAVYEFVDTIVTQLSVSGSGDDREETLSILARPDEQAPGDPILTFDPSAPALPLQERKIGEMTVDGIAGTIDLYSDSWGLFVPDAGGPGGGGGAGKPTLQDFAVVKSLDSASPELLDALAGRTTISDVTIRQLQPGTTDVYSTFKLTDVLLTSYQVAASLSALEQVAFSYRTIEQRTPLPGGGEAVQCWDVAAVKEC
jgi:type VI protein secretion system component Hcp